MKDTWKGLQILTGKERSRSDSEIICTPGSANRLNQFFARFDCQDFSQMHQSLQTSIKLQASDEEAISISQKDIIKTVQKIQTKKASGPDNIGAVILKNCISSLLYILHYIFNYSATHMTMPTIWKTGIIIPVNKKPLQKVNSDFRPITLTSIICKCMERIILQKLSSFLKPRLDNLQFAYIPGRSTEDAVNTTIHKIASHLDKPRSYVRALFIDYSSAFNTLQPHLLINKLSNYGVPATYQLWILNVLTNRHRYVETPTEISDMIIVNTGSPQGCVLSAYLFIIYTNDMCLNNTNCKIIKYADDTAILGLISENDENSYRQTINFVNIWCQQKFLQLNVSKTKELVFSFRKS